MRSGLRFLAVLGSVAGCSPSARVEIQPIGTLSVLSPGSRLRRLRGGKGLLVATAGVLESTDGLRLCSLALTRGSQPAFMPE